MHNEVLDINNIPALRFEHNRSVLETDKHAGCDALEPELRKTSKCSTMASWIAWISPELRGRIFHYLLSSRRTRNYYHRISEAGYKRLYQTVLPYASPDVSHLSANDVITALATVLFAQAFHKAGRIDGATDFMTNIMLDIRPRVKRLSRANYVGNALLIKEATNPLDILLQESAAPQALATVACSIRRAVNSVDERYCNQLGYMFNNARCSYVDMLLQITKTKNTFVCTNHTRFKYYEMDFGNGVPVLVRPSFLVFENDFVIMPAHPDVGGFELAFTTVPEVAKHIDDSKYWQFC
ncbi:hypothetical protein GGI11_002329 [Coemansia sp. RSA 2049]|nr:hypothetical protein H4217_005410 [Coemansia sp. RSA 1939]KAJ2520296.1 hypothetical protein GGI11_002329 [Coemansia sp. RSA 2049]KAJ2692597.1 hypothetical protein GGH99_001630 [Coemansia sp. RSA 1285]